MYKWILIGFMSLPFAASAQQSGKHIKEGNDLYDQGRYDDAAAKYNEALQEDPNLDAGKYNLGNATYSGGDLEASLSKYAEVAASSDDPDIRARAFHNMGNVYMQQKQYDKSIDAYKQALKANPKDEDTKYNLSYALSMLKQQQQQQDQQQDQQDEQDKKDQQDQKQDQQKEDNNNQDQQQDQQDPQQGEAPRDQQDPRQYQPKQDQYSKEELERIMQSLNKDDKEVQEKVNKQKAKGSPSKSDKDW